jgi:nicotinamide riboside kinase
MLISFSGAQSTGKTTLLKHLWMRNKHINFVPEVTRFVKREYNLPINEAGNDLTQTMIFAEHLRNALHCEVKNSVSILDRCSLDGIVYTHWLADRKQVTMSAYSHGRFVFTQTKSLYDVIFYTSPEDVSIEDDGERSIDVTFRNEIINLFERYINANPDLNIVTLKGSVEERLNIIKSTLLNKNIDINI